MSFIPFIILGLIAGAIAKAILPGKQGGGFFATLALGVVGAFLGGLIGNLLFDFDMNEFFNIGSWLLAIAGALILLVIWGAIFGRKKA